MTGIWSGGREEDSWSCRNESLTCGTWCYLPIESWGVELNFQTHCWCPRTACWWYEKHSLHTLKLGLGTQGMIKLQSTELVIVFIPPFSNRIALLSLLPSCCQVIYNSRKDHGGINNAQMSLWFPLLWFLWEVLGKSFPGFAGVCWGCWS